MCSYLARCALRAICDVLPCHRPAARLSGPHFPLQKWGVTSYPIFGSVFWVVADGPSILYHFAMNNSGPALRQSTLQALADRLGADPEIDAAYLLGSAAEGCLRADSDVDIAILPSKGTSFRGERIAGLAADLEEICSRPIDVGILHTGNLVYAKEAVKHGRILFQREATIRAWFEMHVLSMYAELQENRREVIQAYAA